MSRTVIAAVVAVVIAALTAIAYFVTSASFDQAAKAEASDRLNSAHGLIGKLSQLGGIDVANKAERLAATPEFVTAIKTDSESERQNQARIGFQRFLAKSEGTKPDIIGLVHANGNLLAMNEVQGVVAKQWKNDKGESIIPALGVVLGRKVIISEYWDQGGEKGLMRIGVAPVIDPDAPVNPKDPDGVSIIGAIVVAYAQTAKESQLDKLALGTDIAYTSGKRVTATSFTKGSGEDTARAKELQDLLAAGALGAGEKKWIELGGDSYVATVEQMPRSATKELPKDYPANTAGAVLLAQVTPLAAGGNVKLFILLVGGGALAIAMLGLYLSHRRLIAQIDQVELGVADIISGNLDRTFRPVGAELDGLSNGLNVMLARLLGRPEPGEEEFDDEGNPVVAGRVDFEEAEDKPAVDPDIAALAQESEPDYYKRVYTEYVAARKASGTPDEVSFESFIAKLKVNEGKLKAQYNCRAVRFRVVTKDGKVTLKPVPIFA